MSKIYKVVGSAMRGKMIAIHLCNKEALKQRMTALQVKEITDRLSKYADQQRLIYIGEQLRDYRFVSDYGIRPMDTIHMISRHRSGKGCLPEEEGKGEATSKNDDGDDDDKDGGMGSSVGSKKSIEDLTDFNQIDSILDLPDCNI